MNATRLVMTLLLLITLWVWGCPNRPTEVERPEKILSLREVWYDSATYAKLAQLWKKYNDVYPSEDAYANWMYAARYADDADYKSLLSKGLDEYPSNPTLLYLNGMVKQSWEKNNLEGLQLMEKAAALDQYYMDPWFGLAVSYLALGDQERANGAFRRLMGSGVIDDAIMDYSYNMLAGLEPNAILITNGDNDTYPGWILTRTVRYRPDVTIVNRSLLNTDWYPSEIVVEGAPPFITKSGMDSLNSEMASDIKKVRSGEIPASKFAAIGDRLIPRLIEAAQVAGRPVYFASTLQSNEMVDRFRSRGRNLGLVTIVTPSTLSYAVELQHLIRAWGTEFRSGGLDSWQLHAAKQSRASLLLVRNYAPALRNLKDGIKTASPDARLALFRFYRDHFFDFVPKESLQETNSIWCGTNGPAEISEWCKRQGLPK